MNKWFKIITVLIVLAVFWVFYFVIQFIYGAPVNNNHNNIPVNAHTIIAFNGDLAIKSVLNDFILSEDERLLGNLNESKSDLKQSSGIDILSDFILFKLNNDGLEVTGVLVNLNNEHDFKSKFEGSIIASYSSVGLIILNERGSDTEKLQQIASSVVKKKTTIYTEELAPKRKRESLISIWTREESSKNWQYAFLSMKGSKIKIDGNAVLNKPLEYELTQLKSDDISFHTSINGVVPKPISDSILSFLQIEDNQLLGFSANYRSLKIDQEKSFEIIPDGDFIFHFSKPIDVNGLLTTALANNTISNLANNEFNFIKQQFYFKQLSERTFYLGRKPHQSIQLEKNTSILSIRGNPTYLAKIDGSPLLLRLINIFPAYRLGAGLSKSVESIDLELKNSSDKAAVLKGEIRFRDGKYASVELIRNLLELR